MHAPAHTPPVAAPRRPRPFIGVIGAACALLGLLALIGWHFHLTGLIQLRPGLAPMQYNTALCFVLAGSAIALWAWGAPPRAVSIPGGIVALAGSLTLAEYLVHASFGIDEALFHSYITEQTSQAGRMSPVSAFCFTLVGAALVMLSSRAVSRGRLLAVGSLASIISSICLAALSGYALGLPGTYGWGQLTRIAAHTAAGLGLLGAALFAIAWDLSRRPGQRTPRWLPLSATLGVLTGSLILSSALEGKQNDEIIQTVMVGAEGAKNQVTVRMDARIRSLVRMAERWEFSGAPPRAAWEDDAANYVHDFPDLQALEWIDAAHRVRWIVPLAGNEAKLNLDLTQEARRRSAVAQAEHEHQPVITRIVTLFRGGLGFVVYVPIVVHGQPDGFIAAVFSAPVCLDRYLPAAVADGEAITVSEGEKIFYQRDADTPSARQDWVVQEKIQLHGASWNLRAWPAPALAARFGSRLPGIVLLAGSLASILLGAVCFYAQRSSHQATETSRANTALQNALDQVKTLEGLLPICCSCKRVREDSGYWSQIDSYIGRHTNASLSHGYCPECAAKAFKEYGFDVPEEVQAAVDAGNFE